MVVRMLHLSSLVFLPAASAAAAAAAALLLLLLLLLAATVNADHRVPSFSLADLSPSGLAARHDEIRTALRTTGLISVSLDGEQCARHAALSSLCSCVDDGRDGSDSESSFEKAVPGADRALLTDGVTTRTSLATATVGTTPLPLPHKELSEACDSGDDEEGSGDANKTAKHLESLRDAVATASEAFVDFLDREVLLSSEGQQRPLLHTKRGASYSTLKSIVAASQNLEHFHVYSKQETKDADVDDADEREEPKDIDAALSLHADVGLFLAFVPGFDCDLRDGIARTDASLYVSVPARRVAVVAPPGKLGVIFANTADDDDEFGTVVSGVRSSSPLEEKIFQGDRVVEIDGDDVTSMTVSEITSLLAQKADSERTLTVLTTTATAPPRTNNDDEPPTHYMTERAVVARNSVAIMVGLGMERWLQTTNTNGASSPSAPNSFRATRHAVKMRPGQRRAWYGMMHLVPQDAVIQEGSVRATFADLRRAMAASARKRDRRFGDLQEDGGVAIGCGNEGNVGLDSSAASETRELQIELEPPTARARSRLQHVKDASVCNNSTNFYCWMTCQDIPEADRAQELVEDGYSLYCVDPSVMASSGDAVSESAEGCNDPETGEIGGAMNAACTGVWQPTEPGVPTTVSFDFSTAAATDEGGEGDADNAEEPYCYGGTSMYMDGFHWQDSICVIYLFPEWVLSSAGKLAGASIGTLFFGMVLEAVIFARRRVVGSFEGWKRLLASGFMYGTQLTLGYLLMLVVMTYSGPLFMCVILGLVAGHVVMNAPALLKVKPKYKKPDEAETGCCGGAEEGDGGCCGAKEEGGCCGAKEEGGCCGAKEEGGCCRKQEAETRCCSSDASSYEKDSEYNVPEGSTPCCQNRL